MVPPSAYVTLDVTPFVRMRRTGASGDETFDSQALLVTPLTAPSPRFCSNRGLPTGELGGESQVSGTQGGSAPGRRQSPSLRFIEQFLRQSQKGRLAGLLLGQLDAFNRIATTFGHERCESFCNDYVKQLREFLPPRTPILRLSERRFAVLLDCDSMSKIMDTAVDRKSVV